MDRRRLVLGLVTFLWCCLGLAVPATHGGRVTADEPQYLLSATSLVEDGDLDIADELADERWRDFHEAALPEQTKPLEGGRRLSPHDPLLPVLLAVPVGLGGWVGAKVFMAAVAGVLAVAAVAVGLESLGLPAVRPFAVETRRLPAVYPVLRRGDVERLDVVHRWVGGLTGLVTLGRGGLFAHDNTHHVLALAREAAACLRPGGTWDDDRWAAARARADAAVVED